MTYCFGHQFDLELYIIGTFGGILNTIGIVFYNKAISQGPLGEVSALAAIETIMFTTV